jgi:hypothetical protein
MSWLDETLDEMVAQVARQRQRTLARPIGGRGLPPVQRPRLARASHAVRPMQHNPMPPEGRAITPPVRVTCNCSCGSCGCNDCRDNARDRYRDQRRGRAQRRNTRANRNRNLNRGRSRRLRNASDETARVRNPRVARHQTSARAVGAQLPGWRGWSAPVRLSDIVAARNAGPNSSAARALAPFFARGSRVYRITRSGIDRDRALNIGMTRSNSIAERMLQHHSGRGGDRRVHEAVRNLPQSRILVQAAMLTRQGMHPRRAKLYENWLQDRERPLLYNANTTTFESHDEFDFV